MIRDDIVTEFKARLAAKFAGIAEVHDGKSELNKSKMPCYAIFEDTETSQNRRRKDKRGFNAYIRNITLQLEYSFTDSDDEDTFAEGRSILKDIRDALELDDSFNGLVRWHEEESNNIALVYTPIVVVVVRWAFEYVELVGA